MQSKQPTTRRFSERSTEGGVATATWRGVAEVLRDEPLIPAVQQRLGDFYGYLGAIQEILLAGRGLRGRRARSTRAAVGHALAFPTWRSLTQDQELAGDEAAGLMRVLIEAAAAG